MASSKTLAFVTCLYDLVKRGSVAHRTIDWVLARSDFVINQDRELVIFTDPELEAELLKRRGSRRTKIVAIPFEKLLRSDRLEAVTRGSIQYNANRAKVTPTYVQLMWAKYAMLDTALDITTTSHLGWIDLAITHVAKLPSEGVDVFADPSDAPRVHVLRCFSKRDVDAPAYWRSVQGHLAGGLVVGSRGRMRDLTRCFWEATDRAIAMGLSPLDEGLLSYVVGQDPSRYAYSYGDYEDIVRNHDVSRGGEGHCKWIVEDAASRGLPPVMDAQVRRNCMGMYEHGFIQKVIGQYPGHASSRVVETGTCTGYSTRKLSRLYRQVDTVELGEDLAGRTRTRMLEEGYRNVRFHVGDSACVLREIVGEIHEPCLFYLDAHWSGDETVDWKASEWKGYGVPTAHRGKPGSKPSSEDQVPLLAEIRTICASFPHRAIVYIDDYGLFGADGRGKWDVGFIGNDWSHLHVDDLKKVCEGRLVDWVVDASGLQVAIVLAAADEPVEKVPRVTVTSTPRPMSSGDRPLLGLVMIVKNEARRAASVLASYRPYIDSWTILDTGSTDGTQDLIRGELAGIPGMLHEEPFVDFATSRNRALELHGTATVFSIMPNGDALQGGDALRTFLEAHIQDRAGAYRVRIAPGHYYHPLVMRCGAGWHYKWRTHECAMGSNLGPQIPDVMVLRDRGNRTTDEWRQRWQRDLILLEQDRTDDPNDPRPYFYLGQTHECLGQYAEALPFFEQRATMGGYFDEVFEAKLRIGKMKAKIGRPWAEVQQAYLEAYAHDPRRAEPLYSISEHWYDEEIHSVARIFAIAAAKTPKPPTDLFLDEDVYTWKAADRAAISSYYAGHKDDARHWADVALRWSPDDERLRANRAFSTQSAGELFGAVARPIEFSPEPGWQASNPSIYGGGVDQARCVVRTVNYRIVNGKYVTPPDDVVRDKGPYKGWQLIRTRNFLLDLDASLKTRRSVELVDATNTPRTTYPVHGFEDMRLFAWRDSWWATATVCDFTEDGRREIALLEIDADGAVVHAAPLRGPWSEHAQKNWMPFVMGDVLRFIYATHPTTVFELIHVEDHDHRVLHASNAALGHGRLRGGSQGVRFDGGWIFIVHDVAFPGDGRIYLHRFVFFDVDLRLVSMTPLFYFERLGIEFCAGLAHVGDKLVASYAVNDGSARLGVFDPDAIRRSLRKDFVI